MRALLGVTLIVGLGAGLLFATGCASSGQAATDKQEAHPYVSGMMCPQCETVWVAERKARGPRQVTRLFSTREMTCPTCEETAQSVLLDNGQVQLHDCPTCKVTPTLVNPYKASPKHLHEKIKG